MTLRIAYVRLRDAINDCAGYRVLDDDDVIRHGDQTKRASGILGEFDEHWLPVGTVNVAFIGRTVADMNDPQHNNEMDVTERLFRRRL